MVGLADREGRRDRARSSITVVLGVVIVALVAGVVLVDVPPLQRAGVGDDPGEGPATTGGPPAANASPVTPTGSTTGTTSPTTATATDTTPVPLPAGEPLAGTRSLGTSEVTIRGNRSDELGYGVAVGDVDGDGTPDLVLGAPFENATATRSGAVFVFFGPVTPGTLSVADADVRLPGESNGDWAGNSLAVADVSGDGTGDLVVGAPRHDAGGDNAGAVYVVHGGADLAGTVPLAAADAKLEGAVAGSLAGYSVAAANVTGDVRPDVVVGAPRGEGTPGRAYVVDGRDATGTTSLDDATGVLVGEQAGDEAGWRVATATNVTGEDRPAVVVGAPRNGAAGDGAGAVYAVTGPIEGRRSLASAALVLRGPGGGALAGWSVATPGDVDGDGRSDLLVGAPFAGSGGTAYLVGGGTGERSLADATPLRAAAGGDEAGWVVAGPGDVDCDGRPDLLVGAPGNDAGGSDAGAVHLVTGVGPTDLGNATATLVGAAPGDRVGRADAIAALPGDDATGLVVGAAFGEAPPTVHVVYAGCPAG